MQENIHRSVGILTFHYAHNFGAALQAFALKRFLQINGYDVQIVNYQNTKIRRRYRENIPVYYFTRYRDWILPWRWKNLWKAKEQRDIAQTGWKQQCINFYTFQKKFLIGERTRIQNKRNVKKIQYDVLVFGSDQIWEHGITGRFENVYWGRCGKRICKRISYGASIYTKDLGFWGKMKARLYLSKFDYLSVREKELAYNLSQTLDRHVEMVVDPTLLISKENYLQIFGKCEKTQEDYVLVYAVSESNELIHCAEKLGIKIKYLHYYKSADTHLYNIEDIVDAGPEEFINLLYQAKFIVTNSFHGVVFSILFDKIFCTIYKENSRIENLLKATGLDYAHIYSADDFDGRKVGQVTENNRKKLDEYVQHSKDYLLNALR